MKYLFLILLLSVSFVSVDGYLSVPPTGSFKMINMTNGNVTAQLTNSFIEFIAGTGITITPNYTLNEITFSATGSSVESIHDIGNVTSSGCATSQYLSVNSTGYFVCTTLTGSGEINTASSSGHGNSLVLTKVGVDLPFKGIACSGSINCNVNATDITIDYTALGGGNSTYLDDLGDVVLSAPAQFSILFYDGLQWLDQIFKSNSITCSAGQFVSGYDNQTGTHTCSTPSGSGNATSLDDLGDVVITSPTNPSILAFDGSQWIDKLFAINTQSASNDVFITGINNQTGAITTNTFSVNTITCSGTDKISSIDNSTGEVICSTDQTGSGTAREDVVAIWTVDQTKSNIGSAYVNVYITGLGDPIRIDTNGFTTATLIIDWTKVGGGTQSCVIRSNTNPAIEIISFANLVSGLNTNATFDIPTNAENIVDTFKPMCKSTTTTDDPIWHTGQILLK